MTTKLVTFKTNHTILAGVDCKSNNKIVITKPVQVVLQSTKDGPMMAFAPFLDFAEEFATGITIEMDSVLCITTPNTDLENQYSKVFGSGIEIASVIPKV
jgi:hypothetical protein